MTSVANTVAMTTFAVHTLQPLIFYTRSIIDVNTRIRGHIIAFTSPILSGYLTRINETRIVKLR